MSTITLPTLRVFMSGLIADVYRASSKTTGQYHSLKGNVVEAVGNLTGADSWTQSGKEEHAEGETEYKAAQAKGYAEGTKDRLAGKKDTVVGAVTGDREQEATGKPLPFSRPCRWLTCYCRQRPPRQGRGPAGAQQELVSSSSEPHRGVR